MLERSLGLRNFRAFRASLFKTIMNKSLNENEFYKLPITHSGALNTIRSGLQLVTLSSSLWAIGGYSHGTTFKKSIEKWNTETEDWEWVSFSMMEGRAHHRALAVHSSQVCN